MPLQSISPVFGISSPRGLREPIRLPTGLLAMWPMQETTGTAITELLGTFGGTTSGTVTLAQAGPGPIPNSINFNGGFINTGVVQSSYTAYTCATWFKTTANSGTLFGGRNSTTSLSLFMGSSGGGFGGNGKMRLYFDGNSLDAGLSTNSTYNDGVWHHIIATYRGVSGSNTGGAAMTIWIDGQAVAVTVGTFGTPPTAPDANSATMQIAAKGDGTNAFVGNLAMMGVWNRAFNGAEARLLYGLQAGVAR